MNVRLRKVLVEEARLPSRYTGFDSVTGKKNSSVIKGHGHDGTTHRREWRGRDWLVRREDEVAYRTVLPPPPAIPFKVIDVYYISVTLLLQLSGHPY